MYLRLVHSQIFCQTRSSVEQTANFLKDHLKFDLQENESKLLQLISVQCLNENLRKLLPSGLAFHHAGLLEYDRNLVEEIFRNNQAKILICTSTLAMGVNLPVHTVIVKGTEVTKRILTFFGL